MCAELSPAPHLYSTLCEFNMQIQINHSLISLSCKALFRLLQDGENEAVMFPRASVSLEQDVHLFPLLNCFLQIIDGELKFNLSFKGATLL